LIVTIGLLSLAGFPFTPGGIGRWPLILELMTCEGCPELASRIAWVLLLAGIGVSVGTLVGVRACVGVPPGDTREGRWDLLVGTGFALLALTLVGALVLHPTPWLDLARQFLAR
jgi:formate hydrogenlyase subunit 3/multisubunit Na+/H+ antiporter MnhD subunit